MLTVNGLLEYQRGAELYSTTAKGKKFLELHNSMGQLITTTNNPELAQS